MKRIAVDIGGTFTDIVHIDEEAGQILTDKVRSTPSDIGRAVFEAIEKIGVDMTDVSLFVHGTTVGLNTVVQRKGATVGLITTKGFSDILEMGRGDRKDLYNYLWKKPRPLVSRSLRCGIAERTNYLGEVIAPIDAREVKGVLDRFKERGVDSIAVCLLHSYANPRNEEAVAQVIQEWWPDAAISLSSHVAREYREYERMSTTVLDAYIKRRVSAYLGDLSTNLDGIKFGGRLLIVSPSGCLGVNAIKEKTIATFASGPIGGVTGSMHISRLTGYKDLVTMDVGGTSFDVSLIKDGVGVIRHQTELLGYPVLMAGMDIRPIGAGGGSIARVDQGGLLTVGPESAGADPGPMCYGLGGTEATVTDAALVNGLIDPDFFLGGEIKLDTNLARIGVSEVAKRLGLGLNETADGILTVARNNMTTATKEILIGQGYDPRDFTLMSYGGAGGIFATGIAGDMSISRVIVPPTPGVFSARGMLAMDITHTFSQTVARLIDGIDMGELAGMYEEMERKGRAMLTEEAIPEKAMRFVASMDMCYDGQGHYVEVPLPDGPIVGSTTRRSIIDSFHALHRVKYGHQMEAPVKTINVRMKAIGKIKDIPMKKNPEVRTVEETAFKRPRRIYSGGAATEWRVVDRDMLVSGNSIEGPVIVEEPHHITAVMAGQSVRVDRYRNLVITL
jgi:N-methylhydantoinase A